MPSGDPQNSTVGRPGDVMVRGAAGWGPRALAALIFGITALFKDSLFRIVGSGNSTKRLAFEVDTQAAGFTTTVDVGAQTGSRTFTHPVTAGNDTYAVLGTAQTFSAAQTFTGSISQTGATTLSTGTGTVSLNGAVSVASGKSLTMVSGDITVASSGSGAGTVKVYTNAARNAFVGRFNDSNSQGGFFISSAGECYFATNVDIAGGVDTFSRGTIPPSRWGNPLGSSTYAYHVYYSAAGSAGGTITWTLAQRVKASDGSFEVLSTTDSTSGTTGSITTLGGASIGKTLISALGRGAGITSTATAAGTTTLTIASTEIQTFTGSTTQTIQFPAANLFGAGVSVLYTINNQSSGTVTPTRAGSDTFQGGGTTDPVLAGASQSYKSDGVSKWLKC